ncbi:hypothetical protein [Burkholderia sp. Ac-20379]|uniref:hypothetical protein n=1 Tax=Burkholderia sp. Ac-20379 TaxID=2703900 RepID=UPI0019802ED0|nr:hypothetical protein [Burkholderia sp. Ac-20379]MBN3726001.1 hypothetical protein [Burkholderia sp. Ac-20379]
MQFIFDGEFYKVARITGPKHNFLGIRLSNFAEKTKVVPLTVGADDVHRIDGRDVERQVICGLSRFNSEFGRNYSISEVQFVPTDTYSPDVYELLTVELLRRIDGGGEFVKSARGPQSYPI